MRNSRGMLPLMRACRLYGIRDLRVEDLPRPEPGPGECESCQHGHPNLCPNVRFCGTPPIDGVLAEYAVMPVENCFPLPDRFTSAQGAMLEPWG